MSYSRTFKVKMITFLLYTAKRIILGLVIQISVLYNIHIIDVDIMQGNQLEFVIHSKEEFKGMQKRVIDFCEILEIDKKTSYMIQLFFEEVVMLIIDHGFNNKKEYNINIRIYNDNEEIILRTKDNCRAFSAKEQDEMFAKIDRNEYLGISMVTKMAKKVDYINIMNINNFIISI